MTKPRISILAKVAGITGATDAELATVTGLGRSTVQAYRGGRLPEHLDGMQLQALLNLARLYRDQVAQDVEELEMFA
jgi:hypothetical protein